MVNFIITIFLVSVPLIIVNICMFGEVIKEEASYENMLNPIAIYKNQKLNVFGCIVLTLLGNILLCPAAPFYWFYKLCTVGRR